MALKKSAWGKGHKQAPVSREAGGVVAENYTFTITENLSSGDIIEIGCLPAYHTIVDAIFYIDEAGSATYDVGILTGDYGADLDGAGNARTSDDVIFDGVADATLSRAVGIAALRLAPVERDRGIGVKLVGAGITAAGQVVNLILFTKQ